MEHLDVIVVGAGQAGLAASHELKAAGVEHAVLERGRVGETWRHRWDTFCLVTPNWERAAARTSIQRTGSRRFHAQGRDRRHLGRLRPQLRCADP